MVLTSTLRRLASKLKPIKEPTRRMLNRQLNSTLIPLRKEVTLKHMQAMTQTASWTIRATSSSY